MNSTIRSQFPILQTKVFNKDLVYFDNAATTQKPISVIESISKYYSSQNANIHRGVHHLSNIATSLFEESRYTIQNFIHAKSSDEIIFVRGTTEAINLVAYSYVPKYLNENDEILISYMEHHSNIVPWQIISKQVGCKIKAIPLTNNGELDLSQLEDLLTPNTKLVSLVHISNSLGTINPIQSIIQKAHAIGAKVLIDGAQAIAHIPINVQKLDCDFYTFSGHKMYGPTGIGVLYAKKEILEDMPPFHGGGEMIENVSIEYSTYASLPAKFEAGTPNIVGGIALKEAIQFIQNISYDTIFNHEQALLEYAEKALEKLPEVKIIGNSPKKAGSHAFILSGVHTHDLATLLDQESIAIRAGHHCTQPIMSHFNITGTARMSFAIYNTKEEIDKCIHGIQKALKILK